MMSAAKIGMEFLILLLYTSLLFLNVATLDTDEYDVVTDEYLENNDDLIGGSRIRSVVVPLRYDVYLELHDTSNISSHGECNITILVNSPTRKISFHVNRLQVQDLSFTLKSTAFKPINIKSHEYINETDTYTLFFAEEIFGYFVLQFSFINVEDSNEGSFFRSPINEEKGERLVATDLWPVGARRLFPCWDEPIFQSSFNIIIKHNKKNRILSNMPSKEERQTEQPNIIETHFEETYPMPTYHVSAIMLPNFIFTPRHDIFVMGYKQSLVFHSYVKFAMDAIEIIARHLKWQWKCLHNFKQIYNVAIPGFPHDAVSNMGLNFYRETAVTYNDDKDPFVHKLDIARLVGRTTAYQCLNNRIGPSWWSYIWLNQALSTLLAMDAIDEVFPNNGIKDFLIVQTQQEALRLDTNSLMKPLISEVHDSSEIDSMSFSFASYIKGPVILRMLQQMLSNDVFQNGIKKYLKNKPHFTITNIEAFWTAMQDAYEEHKYDVKHLNIKTFDVKEIMEAWLTQKHYPVINVKQNNTFITIKTQSNKNEKEWWIPYTATLKETNPDFSFSNQSMRYLLTGKDEIAYTREEYKWIIVNLQQIGYYRVDYDVQNMNKIANYLHSDEYDRVHVLNRAQIIDDAFYFLTQKKISMPLFVKLSKYLLLEGNYTAWYPMIKAFEHMSFYFPYQESDFTQIKMIRILDKLHQRLGYEEKDDPGHIITNLQQEAARWACAFGSYDCKNAAYFQLKMHLTHYKYILPWWKEHIYCNGLFTADNITWDQVLNKYLEKPDYTLLKFLACSENFPIILNYLEIIRSNHHADKIKDNEQIYIFHSIIARHMKNDTTLDYVLKNFDTVKPRNINIFAALIDIINHVYSIDALYKIKEWMKSREGPMILEDIFKDKLELRSNQITLHADQFNYVNF